MSLKNVIVINDEAHHCYRERPVEQQATFTGDDRKEAEAVIPPFLAGVSRRIYVAAFSFWAGVMPPMPMFGRSWL